jgi:CRISPR-associated exonuclease Cas4
MQNETQNKKVISISDIVSWLYCPRKLYITRVKRIQQPMTKEMALGKLKHSILENASKKEIELVSSIDKQYDKLDLVLLYEKFINNTADKIIFENKKMVEGFRINSEELKKKIVSEFVQDIKLRVESISEKMKEGLKKEELWENLDKIYISELSLESEHYGLRGRVDRVEISRKLDLIVPYEVKSRADRIFPSDEIQLTAYAMLLEDYYKRKVERGIIEVTGMKKEIPITEENKAKVLDIAEQIRNLSEKNPPPMQSNFNKCQKCIFNEFCADL